VSARTRASVLVSVSIIAALAGALLTPVAASALAPGSLSGVVSLSTGKPAAKVTVTVVPADTPYYLAALDLGLTAVTSSTGAFTIADVDPGSYTLKFSAVSGHYAQYLGGATSAASGDSITVSGGAGSYVRASLGAVGTLAGTVKGSNGKAVAGVTVTSFRQNEAGFWVSRESTLTSAKGAYSLPAAPGLWRLRISSTKGAVPTLFSGNVASLADATTVAVVKGAKTTYNFTAITQGTITGKIAGLAGGVTDPDVAGVTVSALRLFGTPGSYSEVEKMRSVVTAANGTFSIAGLSPGDYQLELVPSGTTYGRTFLGDVQQLWQSSGANVATVTAGGSTSVGTRTLGAASSISGSVVWGSNPQAGVPIFLRKLGDPSVANVVPGDESTVTGPDGSFTLVGLGAGTWRVDVGTLAPVFEGNASYNPNDLIPTQFQMTLTAGVPGIAGAIPIYGAGGTDAATSPSGITGTPTVGSTLSATLPTYNDSTSTESIVWLRDGRAIPRATGSTYLVSAADLGREVSVRVDSRLGFFGVRSSTSAPVTIGVGDQLQLEGAGPSIVGALAVGTTVSADPGDWTSSGVDYTYEWYKSATQFGLGTLAGTARTFTPTPAQLGSFIRLEVTAHREGFVSGTAAESLPPVVEIGLAPANTKAPTAKKSGSKTIIAPGAWSPSATAIAYDWQFRDSANDGVWTSFSSASFASLASRAKQAIRVTVTATPAGHLSASRTITVQTGTAPAATGNLSLPANVYAGEQLIGPAPTWTANPSLNDTTVTHQWQVKSGTKWKTIPGTVFNYYDVPASMLGKSIRDIVTARTPGYAPSVVTTAARKVLGQRSLYPLTIPETAGINRVGALVCAYPGTWSQPGATFSLEWQTGSADVWTTVATSQCYSPTIDEAYLDLRVRFTAAKKGYVNSTSIAQFGVIAPAKILITTQGSASIAGSDYVITPPVLSPEPSTPLQFTWTVFNVATGATITTASGSTFPVAQGGAGKVVRVSYTASRTNYEQLQSAFVVGTPGTLSMNTGPSITGTVAYDSTLTVSNGAYTGTQPTTFSYQWQRNFGTDAIPNWSDIGLANSATYKPNHIDVGKRLRAVVTASVVGWNPLVTSTSPTNPVDVAGHLDFTVAPDVVGSPRVGAPFEATTGSGWNQTGVQVEITWFKRVPGGTDIELGSEYTPVAADRNDQFYLVAEATKTGWGGISSASYFYIGDGEYALTKAPKITKGATAFSATGATWSPVPATVNYQWRVFNPLGELVSQSSATTLPLAGTAGNRVELTLLPTGLNYYGPLTVITVQKGAGVPYTGDAELREFGVGAVGDEIGVTSAASDATWSGVAGTTTTVFTRNGTAITGLNPNDSFYVLTTADIGATMKAIVSRSTPGYATTVKTFTMSHPVLSGVALAPTIAPTITGRVAVGATASVNPGSWPKGTTFAYRWLLDGQPIVGATSTTFTPTGDLAGRVLSVRVTASKKNFVGQNFETWSSAIELGAAATAGAPSITAANSVLTSKLGAVTSGFTVSVQWLRNGAPVPGATDARYTVTGDDAGTTLTAVYTARRLGHATATFSADYLVP
jgi:hypothetical protein